MRYRAGGTDITLAMFFALGVVAIVGGAIGAVLSRNGAPLVLVLVGASIAVAAWKIRMGSGLEIDEADGQFLLFAAGGDPERIPIATAIVRIPRPRLALTIAGGPAVEIRSARGEFRTNPFLHQGQLMASPRLRRLEAECQRLGVPVVRR